ncbi:acyltransferase [Leptothermofonsia sp. ETS-13]|uniref:acyltransferase n=1 Tax=Leptothermofonsia sp. ETS-13 TaxID=3035696 RepID=UPI003BA1FBDF
MAAPSMSAARLDRDCDRARKVQPDRFAGFDFLRAIFAAMVVMLHANLFVVLTGKLGLKPVADVLNANIGYLAVPVFFQIALFLFFLRSEQEGRTYFVKKRLPRLVALYLFWSIAKLIFDFVLAGKVPKVEYGLSSTGNFVSFIISGGYSPFYFFFSLIFLTAVAEILTPIFNQLKEKLLKRILYYLLLVSCILVISFPIIDSVISQDREVLTQIQNPLSFLPYVFTAAIAVQDFKGGKLRKPRGILKLKLWILLILFLTFTVLEWYFFERFPQYSRLSLIFGSWLLLYLALLSNQKPPRIITFLAGCSLGIYGLHTFFTDHTYFLESLSEFIPGAGPLARFLVALLGSFVLTLAFKRIRILRGFV